MNNEQLIACLAGGLRPVRRLPRPPVLLALWTLGAGALIGLAVLVLVLALLPAFFEALLMPFGKDLLEKPGLSQFGVFQIEQHADLLSG